MKLRFNCHNPTQNHFFQEDVTFQSTIFASPDHAARALMRMIEREAPDIEVLGVTEVMEIETGFYD